MAYERAINIESLSFSDMSFAFEKCDPMFEKVSLDLPMNQVVVFKGASGSGKSTLMKMMAGLVEPSEGACMLNGQAMSEMSFEDLLPYRLNIGYSFDLGGLLNNRTLFDNLILPLLYHKRYSVKEAQNRVTEMMERFGLDSEGDSRPSAVSGSKRKLACVLRSFVMDPQVLILDDPTTGLRDEAIDLLKAHIQERMQCGRLRHVFIGSEDLRIIDGLIDSEIEIKERSLIVQSLKAERKKVS